MPPNILRVHTEYVLVKSVGPKSCGLSHERRDWRIFPSPSVPCRNCGGGDRARSIFSALSLVVCSTGTRVSRLPVSKRLHERELFARRQAVPLTSTNRRVRVAWCRQHRDWSMDQ
ncbi:uncharacterized protein TNCV_2203311 [Trichonephila clavipes]|nr:uncharacterized protein TNCV_2203311 [Trichonephila clavipes]